MAIRGLHGLFYSSEPEAARDFIKDKLKLPHSDVGEGWLIFDVPEGDLGIHPTEPGQPGGGHDISFYCDDIHGTVKDLKSRGVEFTADVADHGYGFVTYFTIPGGLKVQLYEPKYTKRERKKPVAKAKAAVKKIAAKAKKTGKKIAARVKPKSKIKARR